MSTAALDMTCDPLQSQWQTPMWLARRMAEWVWRGAEVLEPCAGEGNLLAALVERGHLPESLHAVEKDPRFALHLTERFPSVAVTCADFLALPATGTRFDCVLMNSPFEKNAQMFLAIKALEWAREVVLLAPTNIEFSIGRDDELWTKHAVVVRRARLPSRPRFGGAYSPSFDSVVLKLRRRTEPRRADEISQVSEEVWRQ